MIDEIEIVISETDSFDKVCYSNTGISQLETVYKQTLLTLIFIKRKENGETFFFLNFHDLV